MDLKKELEGLGACREAVKWVGDKTIDQAWTDCPRGDWMLWYAAKKNVDRKLLVKCACQCARRALHLVAAGDDRPLRAIEAVEGWIEGKTMIIEVRTAAVYAAAHAAYTAVDTAAYAAHATGPVERMAQAEIVREIINIKCLMAEAGVAGKEEIEK